MTEISAGAVSLDLVIKDTLDKQLAGIKSRIESALSKATQQASDKASAAAASAVKGAQKSIDNVDFSKFEKNITKISASMSKVAENIGEMAIWSYENVRSMVNALQEMKGIKIDPTPQEAVESTEKVVEETEEVVHNTEQASKGTEKLTNKTSKLGSVASTVGRTVQKAFNTGFKAPLKICDKALDGVRSKFKSVAAAVSETTRPVSKLFNTLKNSARRIFLIAGIVAIFKSLRSALSDAANENQEFADSLNTIKANLAVAFQPILTAVMPMINTLMSGVAAVTKQIAAFTSALFGTTYKKSAEAVKQAKQVGKAAKEASKYLADFDEMRVHQESSESSSDSESGIDYEKYLDTDVQLGDWAKKITDAIKSGDWGSVGSLLAQKVNGVFEKINWTRIREKVNKGAKKAADGINGFVENLKWKNIGNSIGEGITTAFSAAYTFLKTTKWKSIGSGFASFLNGVMEKTDFSLVGATLGAKLNAIVGLALGFVETFNFAEAGEGLAEIINGWVNEVNWDDVGSMIGGALEGAIEFAFGFVENFDAKKAASSISTAFNKAVDKLDTKKLGKTVSDAFKKVFEFISTALKEINWENVGQKISDFINGINWSEILQSLFEVIGGIIKATPKLLKGIVENLDFVNAAGLFATLFAPKMASSLLNTFKTDSKVKGTLTDAGKSAGDSVGGGISGQGSKWGYSAGTTFKAGIEAFCVGWGIGTWIYNLFKDPIDKAFEKIGASAGDKLRDQIDQIIDEHDLDEKTKIGKKYEKLGYKIDYSSADTLKKTIDAAMAAENKKLTAKTSAATASTYTPTVSERLQQQKINDEVKRLKAVYPSMPSSALESMARENLGIPKLATGGIVKAPTLALVGDNSDVKSNPEVVAPLSELQQLLGGGGDVAKYLQQIIALLETMQLVFKTEIDGKELFRTIVSQNKSYKARTGASAF